MQIFETERLTVQEMELKDFPYWRELLSDHRIIDPIPQPIFTEQEIKDKFEENRNLKKRIADNPRIIWGVFVKGDPTMMGLCMLLTNDEGDREIGYRFRVDYWRKGFATEMTKGLTEFCFKELGIEKITGDAAIENTGSIKILNTFMNHVRDFFNPRDNCTDSRFELHRKDYGGWDK
tara:strand:+ start:125045 stop:125575 length:531 start_codon:yes stop_codon:yes gene_type:complete